MPFRQDTAVAHPWALLYPGGVPLRSPLVLLVLATGAAIAQELPPDLVALKGAQVPRLLGTPIDQITARALHDGRLTDVHLQIDQRRHTTSGSRRYVFEFGDQPQGSKQPLGADDLVLLAVPEAGDRLHPPPENATEIEVQMPGNDASRWFYLAVGAPARLPSLIRYDPATGGVRGQDYAIGFSHKGAVIDRLVLGAPDSGPNLLDRSKARLDVDLALGIGRISRTEDDVRVRTTGVHAGPLRVIRESEVRGRMLFGFYSPPVRDHFIFYPHGFVLPTTIRLTPTARWLTRGVTLRISMDLDPAAGPLSFWSAPEMPVPLPIDGTRGTRGGRLPMTWYLLRAGDLGLLGWLQAPSDIAREVTLYYRDDQSHTDPPEGIDGEFGDHGFLFHHTGALPAGTLHLSSFGWVVRGSDLDRPAAALRRLVTRPTVRVH